MRYYFLTHPGKLSAGSLIAILCLLWFPSLGQTAENGILDLRNNSLYQEIAQLNGKWEFYPNRLASQESWGETDKAFVSFPSVWPSKQKIDFATYRLLVLKNTQSYPEELAIEVPYVFSSYNLWIDGRKIGSAGEVGTTAQTTKPLFKPAVYNFISSSDTLEIVLQIANFHHSPGGSKKSLYLATASLMQAKSDSIKTTDYILFVVLIIISVSSLGFYYVINSNRRPFLFLSLFVLAWLVRSVFSNQYRVFDWTEVEWSWVVRIEYISIYLTTAFALLFVASLFPNEFRNKWLKIIFLSICGLFLIFTLITDPIIFTRYLLIYLGVSVSLVGYVLYAVMRAFINERSGSTIMLISIFLGSLTFGYVIVAYQGLIEINMMAYNLSFIVLYILLTISMSVRLSKMDALAENDILTLEHFFGDKKV